LLTNEGALLATIGEYGKVVSAIYANIWTTFEKSGNLEYLLSDCEVHFF
jgi:hypothetical protein